MGVFGAISYLPLQLQGVIGLSASRAGGVLLVLSVFWTVGSLLAGQTMTRFGYRWVSAVGMILLALGYGLFLLPVDGLEIVVALVTATFIGTGMGMTNLTTLVATQTCVQRHRIGVATSTLMLFRTFGGAFAVSLMGTVMLGHMQRSLGQLRSAYPNVAASVWDKLANPQNLLESTTRTQIPSELLPRLIASLDGALWYAFLTGFILMIVGVAASLTLANDRPANTPRSEN
jgi:predicted MFS family arabinose efflux permease